MSKRLTKILIYLGVSLLVVTIRPIVIYFKQLFQQKRKSLNGKVALVSGAGRGLGRGLALRLAREGCKVAVVDLHRASAEETAEKIRSLGGTAQAYVTDVADIEQVKALRAAVCKDLGVVYLLVNNAGIVHAELLDDMKDETIRTMIDVNLTSQYWMVREFLPDMKTFDSGHIVAVSSVTALLPGAGGSVYSATKAGIKAFMDTLRAELRLQGNDIKVTTVFPFFINTRHIDNYDINLPLCPILTVDEVVEATVDAVKSDKVYLSIPRKDYTLIHFLLLLPQNIIDKSVDFLARKIRLRNTPDEITSATIAK